MNKGRFCMYAFCSIFTLIFTLLFAGPSAYADMVQTPSDAFGPGYEGVVFDEPQSPDGPIAMESYALSDAPSALALDEASLVNCVCYSVSISGTEYTLLFPSVYESSLMVDADGNLWNVSGSSITGRLFEGEFDPSADTGLLLTMAPCLGNNFQTNHDYGSPNYIRSYYWSASDRLSYTTSYVIVQVLDTFHLYNSENLLQYVVIFLIGCCLICLWKRG